MQHDREFIECIGKILFGEARGKITDPVAIYRSMANPWPIDRYILYVNQGSIGRDETGGSGKAGDHILCTFTSTICKL